MNGGSIDAGRSGTDTVEVCEWTFRRYIHQYEEEGLDGLLDKG